jgi:ubiquinone/menaquinone biosynthesis C-methylase UbiE
MRDSEYQVMFEAEESHWWYAALRRMLVYGLVSSDLKKPLRLLDAGCGTGGFLTTCKDSPLAVGLDYSPIALDFCKKRGLKNLFRGNIQSLPFAAESFDVIVCSSVLYHQWVTDVRNSLCEFHRVLKPKGILILNMPSLSSPSSRHDEHVFTARRFTKSEMRSLLVDANFKIEQLTFWTALLFPIVWIVRQFDLIPDGRDFGSTTKPFTFVNRVLDFIMRLEFSIFRKFQLPFGISIFCIAKKT